MNVLIFLSSTFCFISFAFCFFILKRKSVHFTAFFISVEYFYFFGLAVYPMLLVLGYAEIPKNYHYNSVNDFSILTPFHILFYSVGMLLGASSDRFSKYFRNIFIKVSKTIYLKPEFVFYLFISVSILSFLFLVVKFGFVDFISTSSLRRSGGEVDSSIAKFAFITKFMVLGLFALAVYPYFVIEKKNIMLITFLIVVAGIATYLSTVSRYALFQTIILTTIIYFTYNSRSMVAKVYLIMISILAFIILFFGKQIVFYFTMIMTGSDFEVIQQSGGVEKFLSQFGHLYFSIDAGINNFFMDGPNLSMDIILAPLGVIPSSIFNSLGLEYLSYQYIESEFRSSCINSLNLGVNDGCYVPPYFTGISSYLFPLGGAFLFGYFRFVIYKSTVEAYVIFENGERCYLHMLLLIFMSLQQLMMFIPSTISLVVFLWILIFLLIFFKKILVVK